MADKITIPVNPDGLADGQILVYKANGTYFSSSDVVFDTSTKTLSVKGSGNLGATDVFSLKDSDGHTNLWIKDDGTIFQGSDNVELSRIKSVGRNNFFGYQSGYSITSGNYNVAIGYRTLENNVSGGFNVAIGDSCLTNDTDSYNTAIGESAMYLKTSGSLNTAIGYLAMVGDANYSCSRNTVIGANAAIKISTGSNNAILGTSTAQYLTSGSYNTYIGEDSAAYNQTGSYNVCVGREAGLGYGSSVSNADYNTFIGTYAGEKVYTNGNSNTSLGYASLRYLKTGTYNIGIGVEGLRGNDTSYLTGSHNIGIGYQAGYSLTTGSNNVLIGYQAGYNLTTESNKLYISNSNTTTPLIKGHFDTNKLIFNADVSIQSTQAFYFGDETTDGTWKIVRNGNNLEFLRRESGNYVSKGVISA